MSGLPAGRPGGEEPKSWRQRLLDNWSDGEAPFACLKPLGWLYGLSAALRRAWLPKIFPGARVGAPVVSFGNLTVGGSGKTPMVLALGRLLMEKGYKPAVLSRGYGRETRLPASVVVSRGQGPIVSVKEGGDEPWMMASELPGLRVVVDVDRVRGAKTALELGADLIILDDGFQQLRLAADCRVLLIPAHKPFGNQAVIPAGPLRENLSAHRYADIIVTTGALEPTAQSRAMADGRPLFAADYKPLGWRSLRDPEQKPLELMAGRKVMAFCGLGRPAAFYRSLASLGLDVRRFLSFEDHQVYDRAALSEIGRNLADSGAEVLVTTAKDAVKLPRDFSLPLMYLQIHMELDKPGDFLGAVLSELGAKADS